MTQARRRLIQIVVRFHNAVDAARASMEEAYAMDRQIDYGEWSGPAHERQFECDADRLAQRFGFASADLLYAIGDTVITRWPYASHVFHPGETCPLPEVVRG